MFRQDDSGMLPVGYRLPNGQDVAVGDQVTFTDQCPFIGVLVSLVQDGHGRLRVRDGAYEVWCHPTRLRKS